MVVMNYFVILNEVKDPLFAERRHRPAIVERIRPNCTKAL